MGRAAARESRWPSIVALVRSALPPEREARLRVDATPAQAAIVTSPRRTGAGAAQPGAQCVRRARRRMRPRVARRRCRCGRARRVRRPRPGQRDGGRTCSPARASRSSRRRRRAPATAWACFWCASSPSGSAASGARERAGRRRARAARAAARGVANPRRRSGDRDAGRGGGSDMSTSVSAMRPGDV